MASTLSFSESSSDSSDSGDEDNQKTIHELCVSGTLQEIKKFVGRERQRKVAAKDENKRVALHYVAALNRLDVAEFLIRKRSQIDAKDSRHQTPLHLACQAGHLDMCRLLLENRASLKSRDDDCWTPLHHAVNGRFLDVATLLVKRGADMASEDHKHGRTVLHLSAEKGYDEFVDMLIIRGANMYASGDALYSMTPLHLACLHGHTECTRILVKRGADMTTLSGFLDKSPLHLASEYGHYHCVKILVDNGADIEQMGMRINGSTALHLAAANNRLDAVELLVSKGAHIEQWGKFSTVGTALHVAAAEGHLRIVQALVGRFHANIDAKDVNGNTPLHAACKEGHFEVAAYLIKCRADISIKSMTQRTPLQMCKDLHMRDNLTAISVEMDREKEQERRQHEEIMRRKEEQHNEEERQRKQIEQQKEAERQHVLCTRGAFIAAMNAVIDGSGELNALLHVAEEFHDQDINIVLNEDTKGTALTRAANKGYVDIVSALLKWPGVDINFQDGSGNTALHYAAQFGFREIVEQLLLMGAKAGLLNHLSKAPANVATSSYLCELIRNPKLIENKRNYQQNVLQDIQNNQRRASNKSLNVEACEEKLFKFDPLAVEDLHSPNTKRSPHSHASIRKVSQRGGPEEEAFLLDTEAFARGRFGSVPLSFGGCRLDFFSITKEEKEGYNVTKRSNIHGNDLSNDIVSNELQRNDGDGSNVTKQSNKTNSNDIVSNDQLIPLTNLQRSYPPTAFDDTEEEWNVVKDFLWLIGSTYKHISVPLESQLSGKSSEMFQMNRLAIVLNDLQKLFLNVYDLTSRKMDKKDDELDINRFKLPDIFNTSPRNTTNLSEMDKNGQNVRNSSENWFLEASKGDECLEWFLTMNIPPPPSCKVMDFHRLVMFSHQIDQFIDHFLLLLILQCYPTIQDSINDLLVMIQKSSTSIQSIFITSNVSKIKKFLLQHIASKLPEAFGQEVYRNISKLIDLSLSSCTARHNNLMMSAILRNLPIESMGKIKSMKSLNNVSFRTVSTVTSCGYGNSPKLSNFSPKKDTSSSPLEESSFIIAQKMLYDMYMNPPRYLRVCIDAVYEVALWIQQHAEVMHPVDAVRAHFWAFTGRRMIERRVLAMNAQRKVVTGLTLWLSDLNIEVEYIRYFNDVGFRILSDFLHMSANECVELFEFLKVGDLKRLCKHIIHLNEKTVTMYEQRASSMNSSLD